MPHSFGARPSLRRTSSLLLASGILKAHMRVVSVRRALAAFTATSASLALLSPLAANAIVDVRGNAQNTAPSTEQISSAPIETSLSLVNGNASIFGYANSDTGILRATATAANVFGTPYASDVSAAIIEGITFTSGFGKKAYIDYSIHGNFALAGYPYGHATFAQFFLFTGSTRKYITVSPYTTCGDACPPVTTLDTKGTFEFTIEAAPTNIGASLSLYTSFGDTADFGNTARLFLRTDESYTTTSGTFLSQAPPIFATAVPEPETYALMLAGLAAVRFIVRRRSVRSGEGETAA